MSEVITHNQAHDLEVAHGAIETVKAELTRNVVMSEDEILATTAAVATGSILFEGEPGTGKTMTAKVLAKTIGGDFARIQGNPDLMPTDILGVQFWNQAKQDFDLREGPLMKAHVVLADELNRSTPKLQSAFLEVMGEGQVTIDGVTYRVPPAATYLATQNPLDEEGTNPLPKAQLDRFSHSLTVEQDTDDSLKILDQYTANSEIDVQDTVDLNAVAALRRALKVVVLSDNAKRSIIAMTDVLSRDSAVDASVLQGRAKLRMADLARFHAIARDEKNRNVNMDDLRFATIALAHRIELNFAALDSTTPQQVVADVANRVLV